VDFKGPAHVLDVVGSAALGLEITLLKLLHDRLDGVGNAALDGAPFRSRVLA